MPLSHIALAIMVAAIYGTAFVAIQLAIDEIPPIMATGYRYLLTVFPFIFFVRRPNVSWALLASYGIVQAVIMFATIFSAIKLGMPPGIASMVVQLQVFFTIGISYFVFGEMPTKRQAIGALIAMIGVAIIGVGLNTIAPILPFIMTIASAFAWGVANTLSK
ncbi:MAG: EamA family transporter, partial [Pseudomonadota bacterium]